MVRDWDAIRNILEKIEDETLFDFLKEVETEVRFKTAGIGITAEAIKIALQSALKQTL